MFKAIGDFFSPFGSELLKRIQSDDPGMTALDLSEMDLTNSDITCLCDALRNNTNLKTLNLAGNQISNAGARALARNTTLTTLNLARNQITDSGAEVLAKSTTLTTLDLSCNLITDAGAKALAETTTLTTLNLARNTISFKGAGFLAGNLRLKTLNLALNQIRNEGAGALANNFTLTNLDLADNEISNIGACALAGNNTLETLNLARNKIDHRGAQALIRDANLTSLDLSENQISEAGGLMPRISLITLKLSGNKIGHRVMAWIDKQLESNRAHQRTLAKEAADQKSINKMKCIKDTMKKVQGHLNPTTPNQHSGASSCTGHSLAPDSAFDTSWIEAAFDEEKGKPSLKISQSQAGGETPTQQWEAWAHQPQSTPAPNFLAALPSAKQADVTTLTQGEKEALLVHISTLQQAQAGLEQRLAGTLKAEAEDVKQKQAIQAINANPNTQAYFAALLRVIDQTLLASLVIGSGAVARAQDPVAQNIGERLIKGASVVTGIIFPPVAPFISLISHMMSTADNINSVREIHRLSSWVSSSGDIPAFTLALAIALTQTQDQAIKQNQHTTQSQGKLNQIRHHCNLLLKQLKVGESFTKAKEHAILDAYALLDYMMSKKPNDAAPEAKVSELIMHLTGNAPTATQQTASVSSASSSSTAAPVLVISNTQTQAPTYDPAKEIEALKAIQAAQEARFAAQEAELKKLKNQSQHSNHDDELDYGNGTKGKRAQQTVNTRKGPVPVEHAMREQESKHAELEQRVQATEQLLAHLAQTHGVTAFPRSPSPNKDDVDELLDRKHGRSSPQPQ